MTQHMLLSISPILPLSAFIIAHFACVPVYSISQVHEPGPQAIYTLLQGFSVLLNLPTYNTVQNRPWP
jgi:hypothetical protein